MVAEGLLLRHVADVDLDDRKAAPRDRVAQHYGRVGESSWIDDGTIGRCLLLQEIDERALVIRLERGERGAAVARDTGAARHDLVQRRRPVDLRLARAERVEVGPVHEQVALHAARPCSSRAASRSVPSATSTTSLKSPTRRGSIQRTLPARAFLSRWR